MEDKKPLTREELQEYFLIVQERKRLAKKVEDLEKREKVFKDRMDWTKITSERGTVEVQNRPEYELLDPELLDTVREEHPDLYESCIDIKLFCKTVKDLYPGKVKTIPKYAYTAKPDASLWSTDNDD